MFDSFRLINYLHVFTSRFVAFSVSEFTNCSNCASPINENIAEMKDDLQSVLIHMHTAYT